VTAIYASPTHRTDVRGLRDLEEIPVCVKCWHPSLPIGAGHAVLCKPWKVSGRLGYACRLWSVTRSVFKPGDHWRGNRG
jgi:hypothetical protein